MRIRRSVAMTLLTRRGLGALVALPAAAQPAWPERAITLLHGFPPGGGADTVSRLVAAPLAEQLRVPMLVEGRPGAGGSIGSTALARATPDGYLIGLPTGSHAVNAAFGRVQGYDPVDGFAWIAILLRYAFVLVVRADHPARDLAGLLEMARREPGRIAFGSGGVGSSHHLTGEALCAAAGVQMTHVPYRGDAAGLTAVLAGDVPLMISTTVGAIGQLQGNALRALAVTSPQRSRRLPAVPSVAEAGLPGFASSTWAGLAAPRGTPPAVIARLHAATQSVLAEPGLRHRLEDVVDGEVQFTTPEQARDFVHADIAHWSALIRARGIVAD
jgi:tripartite-type tricarboxylate transporter receptor subunit TctC